MTRLADVLDRAGITRDDLRALVRRRQEEVLAEEQRQLDEDLRRLGRQFSEERSEARAPRPARTADAAVADAILEEVFADPRPPLIETEGCAAYHCPNVAAVEVEAEFNGRVLRVLYCRTHGEERLSELQTA